MYRPRPIRRLLLSLLLIGQSLMATIGAQEAPVIAAAANVQFAIEELATAFQQETGRSVRLSFGSSGNLRRQIAQGAPFQLFLSADEAFALALHRDGLTEGGGALYALGRAVLIAPSGSPLQVDGELRGLAEALEKGVITRFAIANPEHAPYGIAAMQALEHAGLWEPLQPFLVLGENVSQAARFALSGNAQGGIIAYSLALAPSVQQRGARFELIPEDMHGPLHQRMVLIRGAGETARAFHDYLLSDTGRAIFRGHGFGLPPRQGL
jgi:molybdate transport system substrate-binding protein